MESWRSIQTEPKTSARTVTIAILATPNSKNWDDHKPYYSMVVNSWSALFGRVYGAVYCVDASAPSQRIDRDADDSLLQHGHTYLFITRGMFMRSHDLLDYIPLFFAITCTLM